MALGEADPGVHARHPLQDHGGRKPVFPTSPRRFKSTEFLRPADVRQPATMTSIDYLVGWRKGECRRRRI